MAWDSMILHVHASIGDKMVCNDKTKQLTSSLLTYYCALKSNVSICAILVLVNKDFVTYRLRKRRWIKPMFDPVVIVGSFENSEEEEGTK